MVKIDELLDWKPKTLGSVADDLIRSRKTLVDLQDEVDDAEPPSSWVSDAGDAAGRVHEKLRLRLLDMVAEVSDVAINLDDAEGRVDKAKQMLEDALSSARTKGFTVDHASGEVTDPGTYEKENLAAHASEQVRAIADDISSALTMADQADADLEAALTAAAKGKVEGGTGSLSEAAVQLPTAMDDLSQKELVDLLGGDIALSTITAFVEAEVEVGSFQLEGKAEGKYTVMADGTVKMSLGLEAGLGRGVKVAGQEADVSAGGTTELELTFDSVAEAEEFLKGLDDAAMDFDSAGDFASPGSTVAKNVADYVMDHNITSFKTGVYGKGTVGVDSPILEGSAEGRVDAYYDWAKEKYGVKVTAGVEGDLGGEGSGYQGKAELSGEVTLNKDGEFDEFTLKGQMQATQLNDRLGMEIPDTFTRSAASGQGVDVELKVSSDNPARDQIEAAVARGDMDEAADLAMDNGRLVIRQTSVATIADEHKEVDLGFVGGADVKYGATAETANAIWVRQEGTDNLVKLDPAATTEDTGS